MDNTLAISEGFQETLQRHGCDEAGIRRINDTLLRNLGADVLRVTVESGEGSWSFVSINGCHPILDATPGDS